MSTAIEDVPWFRRWPLVAGLVAVVLLIGVTVAIAWSDDDGDGAPAATMTDVDPSSSETSTPLFSRDSATQSSTPDGNAAGPGGSPDAGSMGSAADSGSDLADPRVTTVPGAVAAVTVVPVPPSVTAYDFLVANPAVSRFLELVDGAPEYRRLLEEAGALTLFAPTDDAIAAAGLSEAEVASLLSLHIVEGDAFDEAQLRQQAELESADGTAVSVDSSGPALRVGGAQLVAADNLVNNGEGYVHIVDAVLLHGT